MKKKAPGKRLSATYVERIDVPGSDGDGELIISVIAPIVRSDGNQVFVVAVGVGGAVEVRRGPEGQVSRIPARLSASVSDKVLKPEITSPSIRAASCSASSRSVTGLQSGQKPIQEDRGAVI